MHACREVDMPEEPSRNSWPHFSLRPWTQLLACARHPSCRARGFGTTYFSIRLQPPHFVLAGTGPHRGGGRRRHRGGGRWICTSTRVRPAAPVGPPARVDACAVTGGLNLHPICPPRASPSNRPNPHAGARGWLMACTTSSFHFVLFSVALKVGEAKARQETRGARHSNVSVHRR